MNCYFDGSIGGRSDEWMSLGGLVATDSTWAKFQTDWELMLRSRYPVAPYIHMTDLITGNDPFERKAGWTECKVERLVADVITVLGTMGQKKVCGFACGVNLPANKRLKAEGYRVTDPAVICAEVGLGNLITWYLDNHPFELAHLFYDRGEPFIRSIRSRWLKENTSKNLVKHPFWGLIADVQPVNMRDTPAVQAADVLAWAFTRRLRNQPEDKWVNLANTLIGMRTPDGPQPGLLTNTQLDPITEEIMRTKYPKLTTG